MAPPVESTGDGDAQEQNGKTVSEITANETAEVLEEKTDVKTTRQDVLQAGEEILLQAFNWESCKQSWWKNLEPKIPEIAAAGFTALWLPPSSRSFAPQGYLPMDYYDQNSAYGTEGELRQLIKTIREHKMKPMADIVINHRIGSTKGINGIYNRYDNMSMPWDEHAVTCDSGGLGNPATGAIFEGAPNIDHTQEFVREDLKKWMRWLLNDVGYSSFRFDFAKGYAPSYVKEYIEASEPVFSIGEFWDTCNYHLTYLDYDQDSHRQRLVDWIDGTGGLACSFDFTTKAILQEACRRNEWWRLRDPQGRPSGVMGMWPSRAVTFIDNHDTGSTQAHWPFPSERILQGYAYILTHPGQPSVFYDHLFEWGEETRKAIFDLIQIRKSNGLHSRSSIKIYEANESIYAACIDGKVSVKLGDGEWDPAWGWKLATSGQSYAVWERPEGEQPKM